MPDQSPEEDRYIAEQLAVLEKEKAVLQERYDNAQIAEPEFINATSRLDFQIAQMRGGAARDMDQEVQRANEEDISYERSWDLFND